MPTTTRPQRFLGRIFLFLKECFAPGIHIGYCLLVFLSVAALSSMLHPSLQSEPWKLGFKSILGVFVLFLLQFLIRAADEIKDADYDAIYNRERPLVTGSLTVGDMWANVFVSGFLAVVAGMFLGFWSAAFAAIVSLYAVALIGLERLFPSLGDRLFLNMLVTFPVNLLSNLFACAAVANSTGVELRGDVAGLVLLILACSFLPYEFTRKTAWPQHAPEGKRLYSQRIGVPATLGLSAILAIAAPTLLWWSTNSPESSAKPFWATALLFIPFAVLMAGVLKFLSVRNRQALRQASPMSAFGMISMALFSVLVCVNAVAWKGVAFLP